MKNNFIEQPPIWTTALPDWQERIVKGESLIPCKPLFATMSDIAKKVYDSGKLDKIGLEPAGADDIVIALESIGIPKDTKITGVSQGWKLGGYQKVCERKIASGDLTHASQPLMAWCVGNARVKLSGSGVTMSKSESGNGKIDPVIAMLNAVALMSQNPAPPKGDDDVGIYF